MPYAQRNIAHVTLTPIKVASTLLMSGKVVILHRKYIATEIIEPEVMRSAI